MHQAFNDRFLKACRREETDRPPIWFMRQAGRYQASYRAIRKKYSLVEICQIPEVCAEVTLKPIEQFGFDAAIIFSDIMIPLAPMGMQFEYKEGVGPIIHNPIKSKSDVTALRPLDFGKDLQYTGKSLQILRRELHVPCLGFVGAPFTLASYMLEGGPSKSYIQLKSFIYKETESWHQLMDFLSLNMANYLLFQIENGAMAVQIFDSWVGILNLADYRAFVLPHMQKMVELIREKSDVPIVLFGTNSAHLLADMKTSGADVIGIDWKTDLAQAWKKMNYEVAVQGNLDPTLLFADWSLIEEGANMLLSSIPEQPGFIFNLGHGILPKTPEENVKKLVELVQNSGK